jgi:hypothetical protein
MSALRAAVKPVQKPVVRSRIGSLRSPQSKKIAGTLLAGIIVIQLLNLAMGAATAAGAYEISNLKIEKQNLNTQADIIGSKVNSLSSNQNLVNVAHALGMVSNVNPVFLRLADSKVIGTPKRALANERTVSANLVPNAAMTTDTNTSKLTQQTAGSVLGSTETLTNAYGGSIQASPTY